MSRQIIQQQASSIFMAKINFQDKFAKFSEHWTPKVIAEMNDYQFKLAKVKGELVIIVLSCWNNFSLGSAP